MNIRITSPAVDRFVESFERQPLHRASWILIVPVLLLVASLAEEAWILYRHWSDLSMRSILALLGVTAITPAFLLHVWLVQRRIRGSLNKIVDPQLRKQLTQEFAASAFVLLTVLYIVIVFLMGVLRQVLG